MEKIVRIQCMINQYVLCVGKWKDTQNKHTTLIQDTFFLGLCLPALGVPWSTPAPEVFSPAKDTSNKRKRKWWLNSAAWVGFLKSKWLWSIQIKFHRYRYQQIADSVQKLYRTIIWLLKKIESPKECYKLNNWCELEHISPGPVSKQESSAEALTTKKFYVLPERTD